MVPRTVLLPVQVNGSKFFCNALMKPRAESHLVTEAVVQRLGFPRRQKITQKSGLVQKINYRKKLF